MVTKENYFKRLNERFDRRVSQLLEMGYTHYPKYSCFAKSEREAENAHCNNRILQASVFHCDEYYWNSVVLGKEVIQVNSEKELPKLVLELTKQGKRFSIADPITIVIY